LGWYQIILLGDRGNVNDFPKVSRTELEMNLQSPVTCPTPLPLTTGHDREHRTGNDDGEHRTGHDDREHRTGHDDRENRKGQDTTTKNPGPELRT